MQFQNIRVRALRQGSLKSNLQVLKYVEETFLGESILKPESTEEEIQQVFQEYWQFIDYEERQNAVRKALKQGKTISEGRVDYDRSECEYASIFEEIWKILEENGDGNFEAIDDDLSY